MEGGKSENPEKNPRRKAKTNNNLNPHETASMGIELGSQRWEASAYPLRQPRSPCNVFRVRFPDYRLKSHKATAYPIYTLTLSFQATFRNPTIFHHIDIDHVGTHSSFASCAMLMRPDMVKTAVHGCWRLSSIFIFFFWNAIGFYPFY